MLRGCAAVHFIKIAQHLTNCAIIWSIVQRTCNRVRVKVEARTRVRVKGPGSGLGLVLELGLG